MRITTKRDRERRSGRGRGSRERENDDNKWYIILREDTRTTTRLKTRVEPNRFGIMPCASIYTVVKSILEVFRMFQNNLEYT